MSFNALFDLISMRRGERYDGNKTSHRDTFIRCTFRRYVIVNKLPEKLIGLMATFYLCSVHGDDCLFIYEQQAARNNNI